MKPQLTDSDKHALDLLLDRMQHPSAGTGKPQAATLATPAVPPQRLQAARKVLSLLDAWVLPEPSADLVAATLARIDQEAPIDPNAELSDSHFGQSLT